MKSKIRKNLFLLISCLIVFAVIYSFLVKHYMIKGFSFSYIICSIILSCALAIDLHFGDKSIKQHKIKLVLKTLTLALITVFSCFVVCGIGRTLCDEEQFYPITVNGISVTNEIVLYEYNSFGSNSGCLCIKINNLIYKKIQGTNYSIESGYSLCTAGNLIINFDSETKELIMKYKWKENSDYIERTTRMEQLHCRLIWTFSYRSCCYFFCLPDFISIRTVRFTE